jgi:HSP20 family protein
MTIRRREIPNNLPIDAVLERLFQPFTLQPMPSTGHRVPISVTETEGQFVVRAAVPGVGPENLEVAVEDGVLKIQGEFKQEEESEDTKVHLREYSYGNISRSIRLPENVDVEKIEAEFKNGFVSITIPKVEEEKPKALKIEVKQA